MKISDFEKWMETIREAWVDKKPNLLKNICTDNVRYYENPFEEPLIGSEAVVKEWESVPLTQKDINFTYQIICVKDDIGIAHWTAKFTRIQSNKTDILDGVFVVKLNDLGLCTEFRWWWVVKNL